MHYSEKSNLNNTADSMWLWQ